jgi:putative ABC transport system permease protein
MIWTALKMLTGDRTKYFGIIFGVAFAALLIAFQLSVFCGIMLLTTSQIRDVEGVDLWVMDRDVESVDDHKPMSDTALYRIRSTPGVRWAVPFYKGGARVRLISDFALLQRQRPLNDNGRTYWSFLGVRFPSAPRRQVDGADPEGGAIFHQVMLLGVDDATLIGAPRPENILLGSLRDLRRPEAVLVDQYSCRLLWRGEGRYLKEPKDYERFIGRTFEMNDHRAVVVGICQASPNFGSLPIIYTTFSRARQFVPESKSLAFMLVKAQDGTPLEQVRQDIAARTAMQLKARTSEELTWDTVWYYITHTGIPANFIITVTLGFVVGTAIAGQTFYQFTLANLNQFGALKAMGTSNGSILGMILLQSLVVGPIGYSLGVGLAALFGSLLQKDPSNAFFMPWQVLVLTGVAVMVICLLSSLLSIRRVLVLEPAIVFRA